MVAHRYLQAAGVGEGAQEILRSALNRQGRVRLLREIRGRLLLVHRRTVYLELSDLPPGNAPSPILAIAREDIGAGPLVIRLQAVPGFSFQRPGLVPGADVLIRPGRSGIALAVAPTLAVVVPEAVMAGRASGRPAVPVRPRPETRALAHRLVRRLLTRGVRDGLGWLPVLGGCGLEASTAATWDWPIPAALAAGRAWEGLVSLPGQLLGRGPGLTPSGDDIISGMLVTLLAMTTGEDHRLVSAWGYRVALAAGASTGKISAAHLAQAARGRAPEVVEGVLRPLLEPSPGSWLDNAAARLLETGGTSGADLLAGVLAAILLVEPGLNGGPGG